MEKVLIIGKGRSAMAAYNLLKKDYLIDFVILDHEELTGFNVYHQKDFLNMIISYKFIIRSPGVPYNDPVLLKLQKEKIEIISEIELGYRYLNNQKIIAVTGSNGKTTIVTWLDEVLTKLKVDHITCGNIGLPFCEVINNIKKDTIILLEISSFQLENIKSFHPHIAIITNITKNHLDKVPSFDYYIESKKRIYCNMKEKDYLLSTPDTINQYQIKGEFKIIVIEGSNEGNPYLIGLHNRINYHFVKNVLELLNLPTTFINEFKGVNYRLQLIRNYKGVLIYNDGKSTSVDSTFAAINALDSENMCLIIGGKNKGLDFSKIFEKKIKKIICYGALCHEINEEIDKFQTLNEVIHSLQENILNYKYILYSPGCASFDQFNNYEERSKLFNKLIEENFYE